MDLVYETKETLNPDLRIEWVTNGELHFRRIWIVLGVKAIPPHLGIPQLYPAPG